MRRLTNRLKSARLEDNTATIMTNTFAGRLDWSDWVRGLFAGFIGGGAGAFSGGLSTAIVDPDHYNLAHPQKILTVIGSTFLINGVISMMAYLHQNPVPELLTTTTTETTISHPPNPMQTVVKTVETQETHQQ